MKELAGYVANENENLKNFGASITYNGTVLKIANTKYTTAYPFDSSTDNIRVISNIANSNTASINNYKKNRLIYGDGIRETSTAGIGSTSWYADYSYYTSLNRVVFIHGGGLWNESTAGLFSFDCTAGDSNYNYGFRVVLIVS